MTAQEAQGHRQGCAFLAGPAPAADLPHEGFQCVTWSTFSHSDARPVSPSESNTTRHGNEFGVPRAHPHPCQSSPKSMITRATWVPTPPALGTMLTGHRRPCGGHAGLGRLSRARVPTGPERGVRPQPPLRVWLPLNVVAYTVLSSLMVSVGQELGENLARQPCLGVSWGGCSSEGPRGLAWVSPQRGGHRAMGMGGGGPGTSEAPANVTEAAVPDPAWQA